MNRSAVIKGLGAFALATVLTVGGLALAQDDQSEPPPPLVFGECPNRFTTVGLVVSDYRYQL